MAHNPFNFVQIYQQNALGDAGVALLDSGPDRHGVGLPTVVVDQQVISVFFRHRHTHADLLGLVAGAYECRMANTGGQQIRGALNWCGGNCGGQADQIQTQRITRMNAKPILRNSNQIKTNSIGISIERKQKWHKFGVLMDQNLEGSEPVKKAVLYPELS